MSADGAPALTFSEAEALGPEVAARLALLADAAPPFANDDMRWPDLVQFVLRRAGEIARQRETQPN